MDTPKHSVSVAAVITDDQGRALLIQRRDNGHWEPPGGVLELGETERVHEQQRGQRVLDFYREKKQDSPMLEGRTVVFVSRMAAVKDQLAGPIRDKLNDLRYHAVIVMDEPLLRGSFDPESKVSVHIEASDAFVALCTEDPRARRPAGEAATATGTVRLGGDA